MKKAKKPMKRWKKILIAVLTPVLVVALLFGGLVAWNHGVIGSFIASFYHGKPDILSGRAFGGLRNGTIWHNNLPQADGWREIVKDSQFTLGEPQWEEVQHGSRTETELRLPDAKFPSIDGSTVMLPMAAEFARQHLGIPPEQAEWFFHFSTTHYAYEHLCRLDGMRYYFGDYFGDVEYAYWDNGPVNLVLGTAPGEEELKIAEECGVALAQKPVCRDAFVFITGKDNPVDSLTLEQVRGIFSGKITNWKKIGGLDEKIRAFQREPGSGSQTGMEQLVMQGIPMAGPKIIMVYNSMDGLVDAVAEYENSAASIGYSYRYYIDNQYSNKNIKQLKIEGVAPTDENIISGAYPLSVNYYGVIRAGEEDGPGGRFLDWILSGEGQACVRQAGYIPVEGRDQESGVRG